MNPRFDTYTASCRGFDPVAMINLTGQFAAQGDKVVMGKGYHQFGETYAWRGADGSEWASVLFGGKHGDLGMIEVKGERTPQLVEAIREALPGHRCTRADSCVDVDEVGAWDKLLPIVLGVKQRFKLRGEKRGDWDFPEDGRTQYLGAASSPVRVRLYEKGKQPELRHLERFDLVRIEAQVRPVKDARDNYAHLNASEIWGASPFTRDLAAQVLQAQVQPVPAGTVWKQSERDKALGWMCSQYGPHLISLAQDLGSWDCLGLTLREMVATERELKQRRKSRGKA
jgi:hypothetical protein